MLIYPAIDLRGGKVVRLLKGDYDQMTVYSDSPEEAAKGFYKSGARCLHVVDLDGAKDGSTANFEVIKSIKDAVPDMFIEVGGGIRDAERIKRYLDAGVSRTILGSAAVEDPSLIEKALLQFGGVIAVGVDALNGQVAIHGWRTVTGVSSLDFCKKMADIGVKTVIYTDISKDGTLSGTNLEIYKKLSEININVIASGGITFESEIETLASYGTYGAILGKALYAGKLDLSRCIEIAGGKVDACKKNNPLS